MQRVLSLVAAGRLAGGIGAAIVVLCLIPAGNWYHGLGVEGLDHFLAYTALTFALLCARHGRFAWAACMAAAMALGIVIELIQPFFHRGMEFPDVIANTVGIAAGALGVLALRGVKASLRRFPAGSLLSDTVMALDPAEKLLDHAGGANSPPPALPV